ncbi:alkaline phosphatase D family protein [Tepidiforma sp.]|uniref:alkaline phosphatase D family protein n=1 Tax=Tepidiforma sp. TaxID=2682230 RepID=UPI002ADE9233|nr:alkaline phosphatase D family protein [Tepidiforma sp.]
MRSAAERVASVLPPTLLFGGAALLVIARWQMGEPPGFAARPWEATALLYAAAAAALACAAVFPLRGPAVALALTAGWAALVIAWLEPVPAAAVAGGTALMIGALGEFARRLTRPPRRRPLAGLALQAALLLAATVAGLRVYDAYLGPTHPSSEVRLLPADLVAWAWAGAVTDTGFRVTAALTAEGRRAAASHPVQLIVAPEAGGPATVVEAARISEAGVAAFDVSGLDPGRRYRWTVAIGRADAARSGVVTTFPRGPASFRVAFGACASTGSNGRVFDRIREDSPLLFIHTGDFHYEDIRRNDPGAIRTAFAQSLAAPAQQALWLAVPVAYTWDDHDYGGNDSARTTRSRPAARAVYREIVPHYPLPGREADGPISQAFSIGRVRVIITDSRSERDPSSAPDGPGKSMLGPGQLQWLFDELLSARDTHALTLWVNSVPWISSSTGGDDWGAYADERRRIADFLVEHGITNLVMLSGDAHMLAADDGSNNRFASDGSGPGFPVLQAGALDRRGSVKGGPYSEGAFPGGGQYGLLDVRDLGDRIEIDFRGRDWTGRDVLSFTRTFQVLPPAGR